MSDTRNPNQDKDRKEQDPARQNPLDPDRTGGKQDRREKDKDTDVS